MPNHKIDDLRRHLFDTLDALKNKDAPMDLDRARAIADVGKVIVDSAKVEVDFLKVTGAIQGTGFLPETRTGPARLPAKTSASTDPSIPPGDRCMLCGCRLTTPYWLERGVCGSCADRPEAKALTGEADPLRKRA